MTSTLWLLIGLAALTFAIYWIATTVKRCSDLLAEHRAGYVVRRYEPRRRYR